MVEDYCFFAKKLKFEFFNQGETVFEQGDVGSKFYIIIDGGCRVLLPQSPELESTVKDLSPRSSLRKYSEMARGFSF